MRRVEVGALCPAGFPWLSLQQGGIAMLVLTRRSGEAIVVGDDIHVYVLSVQREKVRLGIVAPGSIPVDRQEVRERRLAGIPKSGVAEARSNPTGP
jgi:carbon storage regulator